MARRAGSGTSTVSADSTAQYLAAGLCGDTARASRCLDNIVHHEAQQNRRVLGNPRIACEGALQLLRTTFPRATDAQAVGAGRAGDLIVIADGVEYHCEIKSQFGKSRFSELTQADYVRDSTDALRVIVRERDDVRAILSQENLDALNVYNVQDEGWSLADLVKADLCGMTSHAYRERMGICTPEHLEEFFDRKYLVHLICDDARITPLATTRIAERLRSPVSVDDFKIKNNKAAELTLLFPSARRLNTLFHYLVYPWGHKGANHLFGRHKLNGPSLYSDAEQA